jgi:hypothetical protein
MLEFEMPFSLQKKTLTQNQGIRSSPTLQHGHLKSKRRVNGDGAEPKIQDDEEPRHCDRIMPISVLAVLLFRLPGKFAIFIRHRPKLSHS